jgi:hypothetical protein
MRLKTRDIARQGYFTKIFVQPLVSPHTVSLHAVVHAVVVTSGPQSMFELWHHRSGHTSTKNLVILGCKGFNSTHGFVCIEAKQVRTPFRPNPERGTIKLFRPLLSNQPSDI